MNRFPPEGALVKSTSWSPARNTGWWTAGRRHDRPPVALHHVGGHAAAAGSNSCTWTDRAALRALGRRPAKLPQRACRSQRGAVATPSRADGAAHTNGSCLPASRRRGVRRGSDSATGRCCRSVPRASAGPYAQYEGQTYPVTQYAGSSWWAIRPPAPIHRWPPAGPRRPRGRAGPRQRGANLRHSPSVGAPAAGEQQL